MAQYHGKGLVFWLDGSPGGTLRNLSKHIVSVDFPRTVDSVDTSTADPSTNSDHKFIVGMRSATITLNMIWDDDDESDPGQDVIFAGSLGGGTNGNTTSTFEFGPSGGASGQVKYSGECYVTSYNTSSGISDAVKATATLQITGVVTRGTFS